MPASHPKICVIVAIGPENVIGKNNGLPWRSTLDFHHFVAQTTGFPCIFGATTFFNLPKFPLRDRLNIVCNPKFSQKYELTKNGGYIKASSIESAIEFACNWNKIFICGGRSIYDYSFKNGLVDIAYLTEIYSKKLESEIRKNPKDFVYFPFDLQKFLRQNWESKQIEYLGFEKRIAGEPKAKFTCWRKCSQNSR